MHMLMCIISILVLRVHRSKSRSPRVGTTSARTHLPTFTGAASNVRGVRFARICRCAVLPFMGTRASLSATLTRARFYGQIELESARSYVYDAREAQCCLCEPSKLQGLRVWDVLITLIVRAVENCALGAVYVVCVPDNA